MNYHASPGQEPLAILCFRGADTWGAVPGSWDDPLRDLGNRQIRLLQWADQTHR